MSELTNCSSEFRIDRNLFELYGILMGDGCVSEYNDYEHANRCDTIIVGDKRHDFLYFSYMKALLLNLGINCYIYQYKTNNSIRLTVRNKRFSQFLLSIGFPKGNKYELLIIPQIFSNLPWADLKLIIRGIFDTDGCIFAKKNEKYRYPYINISSKSQKLRQQLHSILRERAYPFYFNNDNLFMKGIKNVNRWMEDIGTSNPKHRFKYEYWLAHRELPAGLNNGLVVKPGTA
jgi:hypothetical protein